MHLPKEFIIYTDRLLLRIPHIEDLQFVLSATKFKGFNDGMLWDPPTSEEELTIPHENVIKAWENQTAYSFTITDKTDNTLIGRISIRKELEEDVWNIGYWTHPNYQNKGYMTESTKAVFELGFEKLNAKAIIANCATWNVASEKVLKNSGMIFKKHIEHGFLKNGNWVPEHQYEITKSLWIKNK